jgi:hypothetical protein
MPTLFISEKICNNGHKKINIQGCNSAYGNEQIVTMKDFAILRDKTVGAL